MEIRLSPGYSPRCQVHVSQSLRNLIYPIAAMWQKQNSSRNVSNTSDSNHYLGSRGSVSSSYTGSSLEVHGILQSSPCEYGNDGALALGPTLGLLGWLLISRMVPILHIILLLLIELTAALSTLKPSPFPSMHYSCRHTQRSTAPDDCLYIINALPRDTIASLDTVVRWSYRPAPALPSRTPLL